MWLAKKMTSLKNGPASLRSWFFIFCFELSVMSSLDLQINQFLLRLHKVIRSNSFFVLF